MSKQTDCARLRGQSAFDNGDPRDSNPYDRNRAPAFWLAWDAGYEDYRRDADPGPTQKEGE